MKNTIRIAYIALYVMLGAIVLTFFSSASWIRVVWVIAAVVCLVSVLIVSMNKNKSRRRY